jgi:SAM-dependent methyltransferase
MAECSDWQVGSELLARMRAAKEPWQGSRIGWLGAQLQFAMRSQLNFHDNRFSTRRYQDLYGTFFVHPTPRIPLVGATVVDLGCGGVNPLGFLFVLLGLGARCGIGVDLDDVQDRRHATLALADAASALLLNARDIAWDQEIAPEQVLRNLASFHLPQLAQGDPAGIDQSRLRFHRESIYSMPLRDGEADVVISNAFLEHIPDVAAGMREISRITKSGGYSVHNIDMTDHRRYGGDKGPLDFLTEGAGEGMVAGSNRLRLSQLRVLFDKFGFDITSCRCNFEVAVPAALRARMVQPYSSMAQDDLEVGMAVVAARKR